VTARRARWDFVRHVRDGVVAFPEVKKFHWVMDNRNTPWTFELCRYLGRLSGEEVWENRPALRTGAQRRAFLSDPSHKHVVHYTPKHGSWLNQIEIWFGVLTRRVLQRGEFRSVEELAQRILEYIAYYNRHRAHPYAWTYTGKPLASGAKAKRKRQRYQRPRLMNVRIR
jgi:transposase